MRACDMVGELCSDILHRTPEFVGDGAEFDFQHPVNTFDLVIDGVKIGFVSVPHPVVLSNIDKKCAVAFFEIYTEAFAKVKAGANQYAEPSKFPAIDIDITFVADVCAVDFPSAANAAKSASDGLLSDVKVKDIYTDSEGVSALTLRFSFVSKERTLSKQELQPAIDTVCAALAPMGLSVKV